MTRPTATRRRLAAPLLLALALAPLAPAPARAQAIPAAKADAQTLINLAKEENRVMEHLDVLSNRIGPRLTGSDNLTNALEWARGEFARFGIKNARLEPWGSFPVGFNRGPATGRMVEPTEKALVFGTNSWTAGTQGVQRGPAILEPADEAALDAVKDKLAGAWILVPSGRRPSGDFKTKLDAAYADAKIAGLVRSNRGELIVTGGNFQISWDKLPKTPVINLIQAQFDEIAALAKDGKPVTLEFDIRNYFTRGPIPQYNLIADIPGTEFPDEYIIVGGHIDSWDGATGTTDNGTGCATTLEAARLLMKAGVKPRRTIRFMLWSGEEQGLLGSLAYVKAHPDLMPKISAVLVHDGGTNYLSSLSATPAMKADLEEVCSPLIGLNPDLPFAVREVNGLRRGIGSDHDSFLGAGVPGFFWGQAGKAVYRRTHHTQYDTYDAAIPEYQKHSAVVVAVVARGLADLDHLLSREKLISMARGGGEAPPANRRLLGVQLDELSVVEVIADGVAAKAGIKSGDEIVKVDGKPVGDRDAFSELIQNGDVKKTITVKREGKDVELAVEFPAPR